MKCKYSRKCSKQLKGYVRCVRDGSVRKDSCREKCIKFKPTFWDKLVFRIVHGYKWG